MAKKQQDIINVNTEFKLAEGIHVKVAYDKAIRKLATASVRELRFMRGGLNPSLININDEDVKRIAKNSGISDLNRPKDRRQRSTIEGIIRLVQSQHLDIQEGARNDGFVITVASDVFVVKGGSVKLRPDIEAALGKDFIEKKLNEYFDDSDDPEPPFAPAPVYRKRFVPAEMKVALLNAIADKFPNFNDALADALKDAKLADDALDEPAEGEGGDAERDEAGFQPPKLD